MCSRGYKRLQVIELGRTDYYHARKLQKRLVDLRRLGKIPDLLLLTEHNPVITLGRGASMSNLLVPRSVLKDKGVALCESERGGDITFHGPGQAVAYPIIDLNNRGRDLHAYLRDLENLAIAVLGEFGLKGSTKKGMTGAWVDNHKVAAIGVAVSRWISYHGLAINVTTDLEYFKLINPCGITSYPVGSIASITGENVPLERVFAAIADNFASIFYYEAERLDSIGSLPTEPETTQMETDNTHEYHFSGN